MTRKEFVEWVKNEVTIYGELAINVPDKEIERIIDLELGMLCEFYPDMVQDSYTILHPSLFREKDFRDNRTIQFPKCVKSIVKFEEMKRRGSMFGINDGDLTYARMFLSDIWLNSGAQNLDGIVYRTMSMSVWDQMKQFNLVDINFSYNRNTHRLLVLGHDPRVPVFVQMNTAIDDEDAFEDPWVKRWIAAKVKLSVYKLLGTFTATVLGGTTLNANIYKELADNDITECKEYFKAMNTGCFFAETF